MRVQPDSNVSNEDKHEGVGGFWFFKTSGRGNPARTSPNPGTESLPPATLFSTNTVQFPGFKSDSTHLFIRTA
jgi:hypothetical protein